MKTNARTAAFREAKKQYANFLATVLWQLADTRGRFALSMHCALFGLWRQVETVQGDQTFKVLYRIALAANALAWRNPTPCADVPPAGRHAQTHREIGQAVRQAIATLPLEQSEVVAMRYIGRRDIADIARSLGVSQSMATRQINQAVATLRRQISGEATSAA